MNHKKKTLTFIGLFYLLNIINTYFVTSAVLNRYLTSFHRTVTLELNAIIGNIAVLTIFLFVGFIFIKRTSRRMVYMIHLTFALNIIIYSLGIFTKYYQTVFSLYELTLFKNPALALAGSIFIESVKELFSYYRIVVFMPTFVLLGLYLYIVRKNRKENIIWKNDAPFLTYLPLNLMVVIASFILSASTLGIFNTSMKTKWPIFAERPLYGVQNAGLYNFYFGQILGLRYQDQQIVEANPEDYKEDNRNTDSYTNLFGETYGKTLHKGDSKTVWLDPKVDNETLNGIFKDKNLVVIHLESFAPFLLDEDNPYLDGTYFKNLKALLKESYVLNNFYTNVGLGNSSDAEFSVMTGLYPTGETTIYWKYPEIEYNFMTLPKLFKDRLKVSLHGDVVEFYNRAPVHQDMFGFDHYYYFNPNEPFVEGTNNGYYVFKDYIYKSTEESPWLSDFALLDWMSETQKKAYNNNQKTLLFPITIQPHTPYFYDNHPARWQKGDLNVDQATLRYLNYEAYYDKFFEYFIEKSKEEHMKDTVYLFYSDHGPGISKNDYETIMGRECSLLEFQQASLKTLAFIYAPNSDDIHSELPSGLIKGIQPKVRSQVDLYRTVVELFNLETNHYYFGVNALSDETTFSIDTRTFNIITDEYYLVGKRLLDDLPLKSTNIYPYTPGEYQFDPKWLFEQVFNYKLKMDRAMDLNLYQYLVN